MRTEGNTEEAEMIQGMIAEAEDTARRETARDILIELASFLGDNPAEDAGITAAMEIIENNFPH